MTFTDKLVAWLDEVEVQPMTPPLTPAGQAREPGTYRMPDGSIEIIVDLEESASWLRDQFPDEVELVERQAADRALAEAAERVDAALFDLEDGHSHPGCRTAFRRAAMSALIDKVSNLEEGASHG